MINEGTVKIIMVKVVNVELEFYLPCASFSVLSSNLKHSGPLGQLQLDGNTERASVAEAEFDSQSQSISQGSSCCFFTVVAPCCFWGLCLSPIFWATQLKPQLHGIPLQHRLPDSAIGLPLSLMLLVPCLDILCHTKV